MANEESDSDVARVQRLALRYGFEFVDLREFQLDPTLLKKVPVELIFRYNCVPLKETREGQIAIAIADPSQLMLIDELRLLLGKRIVIHVATLAGINRVLKRYPPA